MAKEEKQKWFAGALSAYGRLGVHELRNALYPESNVAQHHSEYGMPFSPTPSQIVEAQEQSVSGPEKANDLGPDSLLNERMQAAQSRGQERDTRDARDMERE